VEINTLHYEVPSETDLSFVAAVSARKLGRLEEWKAAANERRSVKIAITAKRVRDMHTY
jgi:hypothetical protein